MLTATFCQLSGDLVMMEYFLPRPHGTELVGLFSEVVASVQKKANQ